MERVIVLGRGGAGKSTLAAQLGHRLDLPVIELDKVFWSASLEPLDRTAWIERQQQLAASDRWIMDGDLGPYDVLEPRLIRADTVLLLDFALARCAWNAARRSRERWDFWRWVLTWRLVHRGRIKRELFRHAPRTRVVVLRNPNATRRFLAGVKPANSG